MKYDLKIISDYVQGNDIEGYDIEELENNPSFMKAVIMYTNDKKMYSFCGENAKNNYEFVKFVIEKFKQDPNFVLEVADEFFTNNVKKDEEQGTYNCFELSIIMCEMERSLGSGIAKYKMYREAQYFHIMQVMQIEKQKQGINNHDIDFLVLESMFGEQLKILDYFIDKTLQDIFVVDGIFDIDRYLHINYRNVKSIKEQPIATFLISLINNHSSSLADYLACNIELLGELIPKVEKAINNWDNYNQMQYKNQSESLIEGIHVYYLENEHNLPSFSEDELVEYLIKKYHLQNYFESLPWYQTNNLEEMEELYWEGNSHSGNYDDIAEMGSAVDELEESSGVPYDTIEIAEYEDQEVFDFDSSRLADFKCIRFAKTLVKKIFNEGFNIENMDVILEECLNVNHNGGESVAPIVGNFSRK